MKPIFGYIIPGTVKEAPGEIRVDFADIEGHLETLVARNGDEADTLIQMIDNQINYMVCAKGAEVIEIEGSVVADGNGLVGTFQDGVSVIFPQKMNLQPDTGLRSKFRGFMKDGVFHAFTARVWPPEPESALHMGT